MSSGLPDYIASAVPNPMEKRAPWYKNTAPTYAGIFLWFAFWAPVAQGGNELKILGGSLAAGVGVAILGIIVSALVCHFLFYLIPGLLGMKTGLPLYIVGTSTYGAQGGLIMPGFLMGVLQFGWLGVNTYFSAKALSVDQGGGMAALFVPFCIIWAAGAAFVGLKGIQYVARFATYLPLIPLAILLILLVSTIGGIGSFDPAKLVETQKALPVISNAAEATPQALALPHLTAVPAPALGALGAIALIVTYIVGFFATAGAAGVDFGTNARDRKDVSMGGLVGIAIAILFTTGVCVLFVAGVYGKYLEPATASNMNATALMPKVIGGGAASIFMILLTIASFPGACFSSFIAANSFKTVMPKVNPILSVGVGAIVSMVLAITGWAGDVIGVFGLIGASFGPICGAMMVDYLLSKETWTGPRAGFNPAGWLSWAIGFVVGILPNEMLPAAIRVNIPAAPVAAFIVGAGVYYICAKMNMLSPVVPYRPAEKPVAPSQKA